MRVHRLSSWVAPCLLLVARVSFAQIPAIKLPGVQTVDGVTSVVTTVPVDLTSSTRFVAPLPGTPVIPAARVPKVVAVAPPSPAPAADDAITPHTPNLADVFGRIPRMEWGLGVVVKPAEIVTTGPATVSEPVAPALVPLVQAAPEGAKGQREKTTSGPRDPNAPAPALAKGACKEVPR